MSTLQEELQKAAFAQKFGQQAPFGIRVMAVPTASKCAYCLGSTPPGRWFVEITLNQSSRLVCKSCFQAKARELNT